MDEAQVIQQAQVRLLQKRGEQQQALSRPTLQIQIGSVDHHSQPIQTAHNQLCPTCDSPMVAAPSWIGGVPYCPVCADAQEIIEKERLKSEEQEKSRRLQQSFIDRYLADSCIGARFRGATFDDYKPVNKESASNLMICREFAESFSAGSGKSLIMVGTTGTGKNMLSSIIGQEVIKKGHPFLHTTALKVVRRFKDSWKTKAGETEAEILAYFIAPEVLVIDEVGVQYGTEAEQIYLTEVINDRYEAMKSTILISNLTLQQMETVLGARTMERFHENGTKILIFNWKSHRRSNSTALQVVRAA